VVKKCFIKLVLSSKKLSSISLHLVKLTGKSNEKIHPKHLIPKNAAWFLEFLKDNDVVLDIGCGNGQNTLKAAAKCCQVTGLEIDRRQLQIAQKEKRRKKLTNLKFIKTDLEKKLKIKSNYYTKVLILDVLEHLHKRKQILDEINRVLKKDGYLFVSVPNKNTSWKKTLKKADLPFYSDSDHKIEYNKKEIFKELNKSGFEVVKLMPIIYDTPWVGFIDIIGGLSLTLYKQQK